MILYYIYKCSYVISLSALADDVEVLSEHPVPERILLIGGVIPDAYTTPVNPERAAGTVM